jgi:hypothetical protein
MKILSESKVNKLIKIGEEYNCPFHLPPFMGRLNPFLDISNVENDTVKAIKMLSDTFKLGCKNKIHYINDRVLMEIEPK